MNDTSVSPDKAQPIQVSVEENDALVRIVLSTPKANILDRAMVGAIRAAVKEYSAIPTVKGFLFEGAGKHFSFGASVAEHTPEQVGEMLPEFHALFRELGASQRVTMAAVTGQCLGGGLELAAFCHRVVAAPGSALGNPEIKLGVFAPLASAVLPRRMSQRHADDLLLTGRSVSSAEALVMGLVDDVGQDPSGMLIEWFRTHLAPLSASSLRLAVQAARANYMEEVLTTLDQVEALYLERLMKTDDAVEGIHAFLDRRRPEWTHR